jgi:hypothetical protein
MSYSGLLRREALVKIDVSEELIASIMVKRIDELTTLTVTNNPSTLKRNTTQYYTVFHGSVLELLVTVNVVLRLPTLSP